MRKQKLDKSDPINEDEGVKIKVKVIKNRFAKGNPYTVCEYLASYTDGITTLFELPKLLEDYNIMEKRGSWYYWYETDNTLKMIDGEEAKWRSKSDLVEFLRNNEEYKKYFEELIAAKHSAKSLSAEEIREIEEREKQIAKEVNKQEKEMNITEDEVAVTSSKKKVKSDEQMKII